MDWAWLLGDAAFYVRMGAEAIVYVLSGFGYSIVEGQRFDWQAGDCIFVKPGQWHQHFNSSPDQVSQHVALYTQPRMGSVSLQAGVEVSEALAFFPFDLQLGAYLEGRWWLHIQLDLSSRLSPPLKPPCILWM